MQDFIAYARLLARTVALHEDGAEGHPQRMERLVGRMLAVLGRSHPLPEGLCITHKSRMEVTNRARS